MFFISTIFNEKAIINVVRIEVGVLAAWTPVQNATVTSYASERYPQVFEIPSTRILTVAPKRTFWEKVTILHKEAFRGDNKFPSRYSRHYYDLFCMDSTEVKEEAYTDLDLLDRVVKFKSKFYHSASAHYDLAKPGSMRLMPPVDCIDIIRSDYEHMKNMIFGEQPGFDDIMDGMHRMEQENNDL